VLPDQHRLELGGSPATPLGCMASPLPLARSPPGQTATDIDGRKRTLSEFAGKVTIVVNVASHCSLTDSNYRGGRGVQDEDTWRACGAMQGNGSCTWALSAAWAAPGQLRQLPNCKRHGQGVCWAAMLCRPQAALVLAPVPSSLLLSRPSPCTPPAVVSPDPVTPGLKSVYDKYHDHGLEILAFPSNQFGKQEPGANKDIKLFALKHYNATFPMFEKVGGRGVGPARRRPRAWRAGASAAHASQPGVSTSPWQAADSRAPPAPTPTVPTSPTPPLPIPGP
jgi:glutathione peroxidase-family protein